MSIIKFRRAHFDEQGKFMHFSEWGYVKKDIFQSPSSNGGEDRSKAINDQFTNYYDSHGAELYENDCVEIRSLTPKALVRTVVQLNEGCFSVQWFIKQMSLHEITKNALFSIVKIGTVHGENYDFTAEPQVGELIKNDKN